MLETWYGLFVIAYVIRNRRNISGLLVVCPPLLFVPILRFLLTGSVPIAVIVHDLLGIMALSRSGRTRALLAQSLRALEAGCLKSCGTLVALSRGMQQALVTRYGLDPSFIKVHYPFSHLTAALPHATLPVLDAAGINVVYSGALGEKQMPALLLETMTELCRLRSTITCHMFSEGPLVEQLRGRYASVERVQFHPLVSESELPILYAKSSLHIIPQAPGTGSGAFPSKLPNLVATGTPFIAICDPDSELAQVIDGIACAAHTPIDGPQAIAAELLGFIDMLADTSHHCCLAQNRALLRERFSLDALVEDVLEALLPDAQRGPHASMQP